MARESKKTRRLRATAILKKLAQRYPDAHIELRYRPDDAWQLLVAVVLSAQCTDVKVNTATPDLFKRFADIQAFAQAQPRHILPYIRSLGLAPTKARRLVDVARRILEQHGGRVPPTREELEALPGIGRKSASVLLANAFATPALAVDTHVGRLARRLGLSRQRDPSKVEADLEALWPRDYWLLAHHTLIWHGRRCCSARRPDCQACPVLNLCPKIDL